MTIKIDLNRITRREFLAFMADIQAAEAAIDRDEITGKMVEKVVTEWPYAQPITMDGYLSLSLPASLDVDQALTQSFELVSKKK